MVVPDAAQPVVVVLLAVAVAALFGSPTRAGRLRGAMLGAAAAGGVAALLGLGAAGAPGIALAAGAGAAVAWLAPAQGSRREAGAWEAGSLGGAATERWPGTWRARAEALVDPADRLRIESAVLAAEGETAGEISLVLVDACDEYGGAGWRAGVLLAALAFLGAAVLRPDLPAWALLGLQGAGLAAGHALCRLGPVRRHFLAEPLREARVARRARRAFAEQGLAHAPGRAGILVLVALLEGRVVVLAGEGIDAAVGPGDTWQEVATLAAAGLRDGDATRGLLAAVERCGELLARHAPARPRALGQRADPVVVGPVGAGA